MEEKRILNLIISVILIITMTMANVMLLGIKAVEAYSNADLNNQKITTNSKNVQFDAYFLDENKNKTHTPSFSISNKQIMYVYVNVQEEGNLKNAQITINNANYKIAGSSTNSEIIKSVTNNTISLNQLNAGKEVTLQIPVIFEKDENIEVNMFEKESKVELTGTYINGKAKEISVEKTIINKVNWSDEIESSLNQGITKYIEYKNGESNEILLQQTIKSGIVDNKLPIEKTNIKVFVPQINEKEPDEVIVFSQGTKATNGKTNGIEFNNDNWSYNKEEKTVEINVENLQNGGKVAWKEGVDEYVLTYIYRNVTKDENIKIDLKTQSNIKAYSKTDKIEKEINDTVELKERIGNIVEYSLKATTDLNKGYMYANKENELEYATLFISEISYKEIIEKIKFENDSERILGEEDKELDLNRDSYYKTTQISKNVFDKYLGEEGYINILSNGKIIGVINKDSKEENGRLVYNYEGTKIKNIQIETSKPISEGRLTIANTKAIKIDNKEQQENIKLAKKIQVGINGKQAEIKLNETITKVDFNISKTNWTTIEPNDNIQFTINLRTDNDKYDLYKNPSFEIELPSQVGNIEIKGVNLLFNDNNELKISKHEVITKENGKKAIKVSLEGNQEKYTIGAVNKGITLSINTNIKLNKLAASNTANVTLKYFNEKAIAYSDNGISMRNVKIEAPDGIITVNTLTNENNKQTISMLSQENVEQIKANEDQKTENMKMVVVNNTGKTINNVSILGRIPFKDNKDENGNNLGSTFTTKLQSKVNTTANATIYYSENGEATKDLSNKENGWKQNIENAGTIKSYLIVLNEEVKQGQTINFNANIEIPAKVGYNAETYGTYTVYYGNNENAVATKVGLATEKITVKENAKVESTEKLQVETVVTAGGEAVESGAEVYDEQILRYKTTVTNISGETLNNIEIRGTVENGVFYELRNTDYEIPLEPGKYATEYAEIDNKKEEKKTIESLESGKSVILEYQIVAKKNGEDSSLKNTITVKTSENSIENININTIKTAELKVYIAGAHGNESDTIYSESKLPFVIHIKNLSGSKMKNINIEWILSDGVSYDLDDEKITDLEKEGYDSIKKSGNNVVFTINSLDVDETRNIYVLANTNEIKSNLTHEYTTIKAKVTKDNKNYIANDYIRRIEQSKTVLETSLSGNAKDTNVKDGDEFEYILTIKNIGSIDAKNIEILDYLPKGVYGIEHSDGNNIEKFYDNFLNIKKDVKKGETLTLIIKVKVVEENQPADTDEIINYINISGETVNEFETNKVTYKLTRTKVIEDESDFEGEYSNQNNSENNNQNNNNNQQNNTNNQNNSNDSSNENRSTNNNSIPEKYNISGTAWLDENNNGSKDDTERKLSGIKVKLIDSKTKQVIKETTTENNGKYAFEEINKGNYIVIFEYDKATYSLTEYQKSGISEDKNSDVIASTIEENGQSKQVAITNTINLNSNKENIDIGLITNRKFDLKLEKGITKVTVQTNKKTKTKDYEFSKLAKTEINRKEINGANVIVEYTIRVTNEGEVAGYAKKIADYMPEELKFNSELNKDWHTENNTVYNNSLANEVINPGETKEIKLILTKSMTENNTGVVTNIAELYEVGNNYGAQDIDSTPGNNKEGEDDRSSVDLILAVSTGEVILYITLTITLLACIGVGAYFINKKILRV